MSGESVCWPLLSSDGQSLYYLSYAGSALVKQCSRGADGTFDYGKTIDEFTLGGRSGQYKLLTGLSADGRAIFFFAQETKHAGALFRSRPGGPFYDPVDLGARHGAAPSADCSLIYSSTERGMVVQPVR